MPHYEPYIMAEPWAPPRARKCPIPSCHTLIPSSLAMCPIHWRQVPKPIQDAVWRTYKLAPGGRAHIAALTAAVRSITRPAAQPQPAQ